ncbi:hypothetical protein M5F23_08185 [Salmonella enterica]|nr:hypothetical protein [Salmonella enterica]
MKEVSLIEMDGFLKGKCIPRDLKVNETNAEYLVRKFAEAEAKCAALAAENAGLNKFIVQSCYVFDGEQDEISDAYICATDGGMPQTPSTDAFLAEVRAQGVEMFADKYRAQLTALPTTSENIFDAAHVSLRYQIFDADELAAQLRKGAAL